ncbi:MAG TPA: 8-amino-7-oxononanoate synthase [Vicinamibacterales bacterium]|nr:8-amino-7-oxononanoate synthase [Vicinamibacterales bacterium]
MPDPGPTTLAARVWERLEQIRDRGLERTLRPPSGIDFSSNDYLGLSADPRVTRAMIDAIARDGAGSTGSRLLRGDREAFADVERRFAAFKGAERALYFSSGYLANLAVLTTLAETDDVIFSDGLNHASLIDGVRLSHADYVVFPHADPASLEPLIAEHSAEKQAFIVTESMFSMDGDLAPLDGYASLCRATGAALVVDEAHAVGVRGPHGTGLIEEAGLDPNSCISINSAGKALGVSGAFVAGPEWAIEYLIQRARPFIFSTAAPPAVASALIASLDIIEREPGRRARLSSRVARLHAALSEHGIALPCAPSHIIPIVIGDNDRAVAAAEALQAQGFDVRAIRPPSVPAGTARLRISLNALLDDATIDRFAAALAGVFKNILLSSVSSVAESPVVESSTD